MLSKAHEVYGYFNDEQSKYIFLNKIQYQITGDYKYINAIVKKYAHKEDILFTEKDSIKLQKAISNASKKIVIYGAGIVGKIIKSMIPKERIYCYCDINKDLHGTKIDGILVSSPEKIFDKHPNVYIVMAIWKGYQPEVITRFLSNGYKENELIDGTEYFSIKGICGEIYFDKEIISFSKEEIFLDCGCYDFSTSKILLNNNPSVKKIYAFEPDEENYINCKKNIDRNICEVELIQAGLWNEKKQLEFNAFSGTGSKIVIEGNTQISVQTIDESVHSNHVTFIKMDIEGAELEALQGAKNTIRKYKPILAISVYHKPNDIFEIPLYIKQLVPEYKLYIRHYTNTEVDTVLYAVVNDKSESK